MYLRYQQFKQNIFYSVAIQIKNRKVYLYVIIMCIDILIEIGIL